MISSMFSYQKVLLFFVGVGYLSMGRLSYKGDSAYIKLNSHWSPNLIYFPSFLLPQNLILWVGKITFNSKPRQRFSLHNKLNFKPSCWPNSRCWHQDQGIWRPRRAQKVAWIWPIGARLCHLCIMSLCMCVNSQPTDLCSEGKCWTWGGGDFCSLTEGQTRRLNVCIHAYMHWSCALFF